MSNPAPALNVPQNSGAADRHYIWEQRTANCFTCLGQAEISRPKRGQPWVLMIPIAMEGAAPTAWGLMPNHAGDGIRQFSSAKEAKSEAERYLSIFHQYHQSHAAESLDLSTGATGISGSLAISG